MGPPVEGADRCDQFAAYLVAEIDADRAEDGPIEVVSWRDVEERTVEAVELVAQRRSGLRVAVEHTTIESYNQQIHEAGIIGQFFERWGPYLPDLEAAPSYQLFVRCGQLVQVPWKARRRTGDAIEAWTRENAANVPWPHQPGRPTYLRSSVDGVEVSLSRWTDSAEFLGPLRDVVRVGFWMPESVQKLRRQRLREVVERKLPKLRDADPDARTILVLEDRDMALSSPLNVATAFREALQGEAPPDAIYRLDVMAGNPTLNPILLDGIWWDERPQPLILPSDRRCQEFNAYPQ